MFEILATIAGYETNVGQIEAASQKFRSCLENDGASQTSIVDARINGCSSLIIVRGFLQDRDESILAAKHVLRCADKNGMGASVEVRDSVVVFQDVILPSF